MLFDNAFDQFSSNVFVRQDISKAGDWFLNFLFAVPITEYLELCNLNNLELVHKKFYNEINIIKEDIYNSIKFNKSKLSEIVKWFCQWKNYQGIFWFI